MPQRLRPPYSSCFRPPLRLPVAGSPRTSHGDPLETKDRNANLILAGQPASTNQAASKRTFTNANFQPTNLLERTVVLCVCVCLQLALFG